MCSVCHMSPCHPRCPNAPDPVPVYICDRCGEPITPGDKFIEEPDGDKVCEYCLDNMTVTDLLKELGIDVQTAERERDGW